MKRILSILLIILMMASMLVACQSNTSDPNTDSNPKDTSDFVSGDVESSESSTAETEGTDENGYRKDTLPDSLNYDGQKISVLGYKGKKDVAWPTEASTTSPVQDTSYWHKKGVEDRFGIVFDTNYVDCYYSNQATFMTAARAEDAAYDLIHTYSHWQPVLAQEGRLANLNKLQYPATDMPWWPTSVEAWTIDDALYFLGSNSSVCSIQCILVMFTHNQMIEEEGLGDPVSAVLRGTWTVEMFGTYVKQFAGLAEANSGSVLGYCITDRTEIDALYYAAFSNTRKTADGKWVYAFDDEETLQQISDYVDALHNIFRGVEVEVKYANDYSAMINEQAALVTTTMESVQRLEDSVAYSALPTPKRDDKQTNYQSICNGAVDIWSVPISAVDSELSGMLIEAVASSEYRNIAPFYFEQYLKRRYSQDANGMKCFDIIRESVIYDFGRIAHTALISNSGKAVEHLFRDCFWSGTDMKKLQNNFKTGYDSSIGGMRTQLEKIMTDYKNNNQQ